MGVFDKLPTYESLATNDHRHEVPPSSNPTSHRRTPILRYALLLISLFVTVYSSLAFVWGPPGSLHQRASRLPFHAERVLAECAEMKMMPGPPHDFASRVASERYEEGTDAEHYIYNATIWTGGDDGNEVIHGDVLLKNGLIQAVIRLPDSIPKEQLGNHVKQWNAKGAWVTPGIFDLHSHIGVDSLPELMGTQDTNSHKGLTLPWLKSLDGINVFDPSIKYSAAGGVTSSLILPGSGDAIGGQAFVIKLRQTKEGSPSSMVLEPPFSLNGTDPRQPPRWRHMKHATGENPGRWYEGTRMDTMWAFREAYEEARKVKDAQDAYCARAEAGFWEGLPPAVPRDLKWEALVDVLRGKVKVNIHSYSPSDFDGLARLSNEFKFHISAIHHAHEAYLVVPLLEKFYGGKPAVAMFAGNARYKQEAYRHSVFAPKILNDAGFDIVMKSDHPVMNSRYLLYEAAQAHIFGLPANKAIKSVITTPAVTAGFGHRLGYVRPGYDADIVLWDSHPLTIGATPQQVWIDGIPQLDRPAILTKPIALQQAPKSPNWDQEIKATLKYRGLPPLKGSEAEPSQVAFLNIGSVWEKDPVSGAFVERRSEDNRGVMIFENGRPVCSTFHDSAHAPRRCGSTLGESHVGIYDLDSGSMAPGLISFGGQLGVTEIEMEPSALDGEPYGPFDKEFTVVGDLARAVDGLSFEGRNMLLAYRGGVTRSVAAPITHGFFSGLSVAFSNGASHALEEGAIVQDIVALHIRITADGQPSVSTQIGLLRQILLSDDTSKVTGWFRLVKEGKIPMVVQTHNADVMAKFLTLKAEVEATTETRMKMAFHGGMEAHLLAAEIAAADVGVILTPARSTLSSWDSQRILPGPPLSKDTAVTKLVSHNVTVGIGILEGWEAHATRLELAWAMLSSDGLIGKGEALSLASTNLEKIFGIPNGADEGEWVAYRGGDMFDPTSKVVAVVSPRRRRVDNLRGYACISSRSERCSVQEK